MQSGVRRQNAAGQNKLKRQNHPRDKVQPGRRKLNHASPVNHGLSNFGALFLVYHWRTEVMSGKRLLDAIQFLNVAKSVATKHLAVRQRQLDVFTRTSSLTKGIKNQTDGLILTAKAAAALAKRFDDTPPSQSQTTSAGPSEPSSRTQNEPHVGVNIPASTTGAGGNTVKGQLGVSPQQEEFYQPSREPAAEPAGTPRVKVPQAASDTQVGLDENINAEVYQSPLKGSPGRDAEANAGPDRLKVSPQQEEFYHPTPEPAAGRTGSPKVELPRATNITQTGLNEDINAETYQSPVAQEQELPEEMMKDIFHSPKVARTLSRKAAADLRFRPLGTREGAAEKVDTRGTGNIEPPTVEDIVPSDSKVNCHVSRI